MDLSALPAWLEASALATAIRNSLYLFALIESFHVVGVSIVVGTVLVIDLRLLGLASIRRPFTVIATDVFRWTWLAFALAVATGASDVRDQRHQLLRQHLLQGEDGDARARRSSTWWLSS